MDAIKAKKIISDNKLVDKKKSREIIAFIKDKKKKLSFNLKKDESNKIEKIRKEYNLIKKKNENYTPRNLPFYKIIKRKYKDFTWDKINKHYDIKFNSSYINQRVTLASLLLEKITKKIEPKNAKNKKEKLIKQFLNSGIFVKINEENKKMFIKLISSLGNSDELIIVSPVCPDYSAIKKAPGIYEFTFKELNTGVGIVTQKVLDNLSNLHIFFKSYGVKFRHIVAIGDFEALSKDNLKNLKLTEKKFLSRLKLSQKKLLNSTKYKIEVPLFTEIDGGFKNWKKIYKQNYSKIKKFNFGDSKMNKKLMLEIANSRIKLYEKWFGKITKKKLEEIIIKQGAEYATMGDMVSKKYSKSLIVGADHFKMSEFYKINTNLPVLYLKNKYY